MVDDNYPKNSRGYDYYNLPYSEYVIKYYNETPEDWTRIYEKLIKMAFEESLKDEFVKNRSFKVVQFDFAKMNSMYNEIKEDIRFDDDVKKFIAYLAGDGYFDAIGNPKIELWLSAKNLDKPFIKADKNTQGHSLLEHVGIENGMNALKSMLLSSFWWQYK